MAARSTNQSYAIAKKYIEGKKLTDIEKLILLYSHYREMLATIEDDTDLDIELEEEIAASWVQALFESLELTYGSIDLEIAARTIYGAPES